MPLTTLSAVKTQGGIPSSDTSRDAQLRLLIDGISSVIKTRLNRDLESQEYTEFYSGNDSPFLLLRQYPVIVVTSVCVDDAGYFGAGPGGFNASQNLVDGLDYALMTGAGNYGSSGKLRRIGGTWPRTPARAVGVIQNLPGIPSGNIKVKYTAGFAVIPPAITMAVNAAVLKQLAMASVGGGVSQMGYEDANIAFLSPRDSAGLFASIESILASFRSIPI